MQGDVAVLASLIFVQVNRLSSTSRAAFPATAEADSSATALSRSHARLSRRLGLSATTTPRQRRVMVDWLRMHSPRRTRSLGQGPVPGPRSPCRAG
jgi:hypothetical protein